jgi:hypothetical protein
VKREGAIRAAIIECENANATPEVDSILRIGPDHTRGPGMERLEPSRKKKRALFSEGAQDLEVGSIDADEALATRRSRGASERK